MGRRSGREGLAFVVGRQIERRVKYSQGNGSSAQAPSMPQEAQAVKRPADETTKSPPNLASVSLASLLGVKKKTNKLTSAPTQPPKAPLNTRWSKVVREETPAAAANDPPPSASPQATTQPAPPKSQKFNVGPTLDEAAQVARRSNSGDPRKSLEGRLVSLLGESSPRLSPASVKTSGLFGSGLPAAAALLASPAKWAPFPSAKSTTGGPPAPLNDKKTIVERKDTASSSSKPVFNNDLAFAIGKYTQKLGSSTRDDQGADSAKTWRRQPSNPCRKEVLRKALAGESPRAPVPVEATTTPFFLNEHDGAVSWGEQFAYQDAAGQASQLFDLEKLWEDSASNLILEESLLESSEVYSKTVTPPCHVHPGLTRAFAKETAPHTENPFISSVGGASMYHAPSVFPERANTWCEEHNLSFPRTYTAEMELYSSGTRRQSNDDRALI